MESELILEGRRSIGLRYPEQLIAIMREDLTQYGVKETRSPEQVDQALSPQSGTVLMVVSSVCGCAAGKARPAVGLALKHSVNKPDSAATVFAGADLEAVARVREKLAPFHRLLPPSPCFEMGNQSSCCTAAILNRALLRRLPRNCRKLSISSAFPPPKTPKRIQNSRNRAGGILPVSGCFQSYLPVSSFAFHLALIHPPNSAITLAEGME